MTHIQKIAPLDTAFADPGEAPKLTWLDLDLLVVENSYQRGADSERSRSNIRNIAENFSWTKFKAPNVAALEDGMYAILDGQHSVEAARLHPEITQVPCLVVSAPDIRAKARAFVGINRDRVAVNPMQLYHANVAGGDPDALHIQEVCAKAGISLPRSQTGPKDLRPGYTISLGAIRDGLKNHGDGPTCNALKTLATAYHNVGGQLRGGIIAAMIQFFAIHKGREIDQDRLVKVIAGKEAAELERSATVYRNHFRCKASVAIRVLITRDYNKGLGTERRLPEEA